jgi:hypothetical protein
MKEKKMTIATALNAGKTLTRDTYGSLFSNFQSSPSDKELMASAHRLAALADGLKLIDRAFDDMSWEKCRGSQKKIGWACHHEIYDVSPDGKTAIVCARDVEGTKYGQKTVSKTYFLVKKHYSKCRVKVADKALVAKFAKISTEVGSVIKSLAKGVKYSAPANKKRIGYKLVRHDGAGNFTSAWDNSAWVIGKTRTEKASDNHSSGLYCYLTQAEALDAAANNDVFGEAREHHDLILLECEISGRIESIGSSKKCVSRIKPLRVVQKAA